MGDIRPERGPRWVGCLRSLSAGACEAGGPPAPALLVGLSSASAGLRSSLAACRLTLPPSRPPGLT